jgi:hypothetical protein
VTPEAIVPRVVRARPSEPLDERAWSSVRPIALRRVQDGARPDQATAVRIAYDLQALLLRFDCDDRDIWATRTLRDEPLWEEEVVELFVAPGEDDPAQYVEIEINPLGAIFDARVANPHGRRETMRVDTAWNASGLVADVRRPSPAAWRVDLVVPWSELCGQRLPPVWRANVFRIERPRHGPPEFSCWSPTFADPPDFHRPEFFGRLVLDRLGGGA